MPTPSTATPSTATQPQPDPGTPAPARAADAVPAAAGPLPGNAAAAPRPSAGPTTLAPEPTATELLPDVDWPVEPIGAAERAARRQRVLAADPGARAQVWFGAPYVFYLSGFAFIPTERPIGLALSRDGESVLFVPRLELEHARAYADVDRVEAYPEYPGERHPMEHLAEVLRALGVGDGPLAGDADGYGRVMGYTGPRLSTLLGVPFVNVQDALEAAMQVKSEAEVALIRASAHWAGVAHRLLQDGTRVGRSETEVSQEASAEAGRQLRRASGGRYRALAFLAGGPSADYRGQVGAHSAFPHALDVGAVFHEGDTLVTGATCPMFGYYSELERTMVLGRPSDDQRRWFAHMLALQDLAIERCRPGVACAEVDHAVRAYMERHGLQDAWRHHVGHNIGVRYHEGPFLDRGDPTVIQAGMLFTVEPGLYVPGLGGFRHSDTVLVTEGGPELLTDYPRSLEALTLPA